MGGKHRMVLGRYQDAKLGAERVLVGGSSRSCSGSWSWRERESGSCRGRERERAECSTSELEFKRMVNAAVERVRRRFGNKYAKVARAYFNRKPWQKTGLPRRTFYHALKKVKDFFHACK